MACDKCLVEQQGFKIWNSRINLYLLILLPNIKCIDVIYTDPLGKRTPGWYSMAQIAKNTYDHHAWMQPIGPGLNIISEEGFY